jgi:hypothetical protein
MQASPSSHAYQITVTESSAASGFNCRGDRNYRSGKATMQNEPAPEGAGSFTGLNAVFRLIVERDQTCRTRPRVTRRSNRVRMTAPMTATMIV